MGRRALLIVCCVFALTACGTQRVVTQPELPPLAPPPPPPRVVAPPETEEQPPATQPEPERKPPRRLVPRSDSGHEVPKTETAKPQPPAKPETATAPPPQPQQPSTLQTLSPATQVEQERKAKRLMAQASNDLRNVNYNGLNADGKGQYETAKRFIDQAQQALNERNWNLAVLVADKAATIASVLVGK